MKKIILVLTVMMLFSLAVVPTACTRQTTVKLSTNGIYGGNWSSYWILPLYMTTLSQVNELYEQVQMKMAKGDDPLVIAPPMSLEVVQGYIEEASIGGNYVYRLGMLIKAKYWLNQILAQMS